VQYLQEPTGWTYATPHTVIVEKDGQSVSLVVTMDRKQSLWLYPPIASTMLPELFTQAGAELLTVD